jgi:hypothetical protein
MLVYQSVQYPFFGPRLLGESSDFPYAIHGKTAEAPS